MDFTALGFFQQLYHDVLFVDLLIYKYLLLTIHHDHKLQAVYQDFLQAENLALLS